MADCKACGNWFSSSDPKDEICYHCENAIKRMNGYAVPVVRCKECKHCFFDRTPREGHLCMKHGFTFRFAVKADDFCSYGERRKENAAD